MASNEGPYVQAACFCDQVIEDKTGSLSLIRVVDVINHSEAGPNPPEQMPPFPYQVKLVLMLKSGKAQGLSHLQIVPELPSGETESAPTLTIHFEGEEKGANVILNFAYLFKFEGLYWFKILVDNEMITSIPLRVRYHPMTIPQPSEGPIPPPTP